MQGNAAQHCISTGSSQLCREAPVMRYDMSTQSGMNQLRFFPLGRTAQQGSKSSAHLACCRGSTNLVTRRTAQMIRLFDQKFHSCRQNSSSLKPRKGSRRMNSTCDSRGVRKDSISGWGITISSKSRDTPLHREPSPGKLHANRGSRPRILVPSRSPSSGCLESSGSVLI